MVERNGPAGERGRCRTEEGRFSSASGGLEPATPEMEREDGDATAATFHQEIGDGVVGEGVKLLESEVDDGLGVAMELDDEIREKGKGSSAGGAEQSADGD